MVDLCGAAADTLIHLALWCQFYGRDGKEITNKLILIFQPSFSIFHWIEVQMQQSVEQVGWSEFSFCRKWDRRKRQGLELHQMGISLYLIPYSSINFCLHIIHKCIETHYQHHYQLKTQCCIPLLKLQNHESEGKELLEEGYLGNIRSVHFCEGFWFVQIVM